MITQSTTVPFSKSAVVAWSVYDWANSAFPTIVTTFIIATYFTKSVAVNTVVGTAQWGNATALAGIIIALVSPVFGAIADNMGQRKPWIAVFTTICVIASALLWFAKPSSAYVTWTLTWVVIATISFEVGVVFYNAMLKGLVPESYTGRVSGWAWGFGYAGGLACLLVALYGFVATKGAWLGLDAASEQQIRICGPLVAVWFAVFSLPLFIWTPDNHRNPVTLKHATVAGVKTLWHTLCSLREYRQILIFLIARMIYIDGLNTVFAFGGIYAAGTLGMSFSEVIQFGIAMNITAGLGAASFAWLDDYLGAKPTILIALALMTVTATGVLLVHSKLWFWVIALALGFFIGPVQAASRSMMVHLVPKELATELFGLYAFSGKVTAFIGPWLLGLVTLHFASQRAGMATVLGFFIVGGLLLTRVKVINPDH